MVRAEVIAVARNIRVLTSHVFLPPCKYVLSRDGCHSPLREHIKLSLHKIPLKLNKQHKHLIKFNFINTHYKFDVPDDHPLLHPSGPHNYRLTPPHLVHLRVNTFVEKSMHALTSLSSRHPSKEKFSQTLEPTYVIPCKSSPTSRWLDDNTWISLHFNFLQTRPPLGNRQQISAMLFNDFILGISF